MDKQQHGIPLYIQRDLEHYWSHITNGQDQDGCPDMLVIGVNTLRTRWILRGTETDWIVVWDGKGDGIRQLTVYGEPDGYYLLASPVHKIIQG